MLFTIVAIMVAKRSFRSSLVGFYFSDEIIDFCKDCEKCIVREGMVRSVVFVGTAIALIILAPMIFVGAGVVAGLKYLFISEARK